MYDAIVVGARCAGSPVAMLLARRGYRTLLLDKAGFPSDILSTHFIQVAGAARLRRWGLLDRVAASGCPPIGRFTFDLGPFALAGAPPPAGDVACGYAPRRAVLDAILAEAAVAAGAELREHFTVRELLADGARVTGIRGQAAGGAMVTERARIVIGADGPRSLVARSVRAPAYNARPTLTCSYYSYWSGVPVAGAEMHARPGLQISIGETNDGLTLVGVNLPVARFREVRADIEGNFWRALDRAPGVAERVRAGGRRERFRGTGEAPFYFRRPHGPGWALVGDAGYHKDPITAQGITDAFRDAELLAEAIDDGLAGRRSLAEALDDYERRRNEAALPIYEFTHRLAALMPPAPELQQLFAALRHNQEATDRFFGVFAGTVPIPEFFAPENLARIVGTGDPEAAA
jgi:flavin-dependent dehydrogenase